MCVNTFVMMVPCIIFRPFLKKGFPVVTSYLWWFGGKSIGYTLPAKHFCDVQGISFWPMGSVVPALFTWINLLGSRTNTLIQRRDVNYTTRYATCSPLFVPTPRTEYMKRSICYCGSKLFNSLPITVHCCNSLTKFKSDVRRISYTWALR